MDELTPDHPDIRDQLEGSTLNAEIDEMGLLPLLESDRTLLAARPKKSRRTLVFVSLVVVIALLVVGLAVFGSGSGGNAEGAVIGAVNSTLADKTAHMTINTTVFEPSHTVSATTSGDVDFSQGAIQGTINTEGLSFQIVYAGGMVYEEVPGVSSQFPGKQWVSIDLSGLTQNSENVDNLGSNPLASLHLLTQQGNTVTSIGASTVDGVPVEGYQVAITPAAISAELNKANLPSWLKQAVSTVKPEALTQKVYVDDSGNLRETVADVTESVKNTTVTVHESAEFSDLGEPVTVSIPPLDEIVPFQQFLQAATVEGSNGTES